MASFRGVVQAGNLRAPPDCLVLRRRLSVHVDRGKIGDGRHVMIGVWAPVAGESVMIGAVIGVTAEIGWSAVVIGTMTLVVR